VCFFTAERGHAEAFFEITTVKVKTLPSDGAELPTDKKAKATGKPTPVPVSFVEVKLVAREDIRAKNTVAKVYFIDAAGKRLSEADPALIQRAKGDGLYAVPSIYQAQKPVILYFPVPKGLPKNATMVAVFGDKYEVAAKTYPEAMPARFDFPQKALFMRPVAGGFKREPVVGDVIEYAVKTQNPNQPKITLFVRFPGGATDASKAKGVMAICVLANGLVDIRNMLAKMDEGEGLGWKFKFAEDHQLAVVVWGSHSLWNPRVNFDDMDKKAAAQLDKNFDEVADAWANGIRQLGTEYGLPQQNFLLSGVSGSAQWAHRLALRKPGFFLAVDVHIPSSFDRPTIEANRILWCLTTGELEIGYGRSLRFLKECHRLGYPIIYKAYIGLGHQGSPLADRLGRCFFEYALSFAQQRIAYDKETLSGPKITLAADQSLQPWLKSFQSPEYIGDAVNQGMYPIDKIDEVSPGFRVALPTKEIAETWNLR